MTPPGSSDPSTDDPRWENMPQGTPEECWARVQAYVRQSQYPGQVRTLAQLEQDAADVYRNVYGVEPPGRDDLRRLVTRVLLIGVYDSVEGVVLKDGQDPFTVKADHVVQLCMALAVAKGWVELS